MTPTPHRKERWDGQGGLRALMTRVLAGRLDEVEVRSDRPDALVAVQRSGFPSEPGDPYPHCRVLPLLSASRLPAVEYCFKPSDDDVRAYGLHSGDLNPLHFDDDFARSLGFEGRLIHGMIFNGWLSRYLGMLWPGPGTLFKRSDTLYVAPVYPGRDYRVRLSVPVADREKGHFRIVAQLLGQDDRHCTISYSDVVNGNAADSLPDHANGS